GDFVDGWNYNPPGVDLIDVNAPGRTDANEGLITTGLNDGYYKDAGTSFSAPQVAALAALIKSFDPGMPPSQVEQIL
ncbi:MAG: S8 family serine peptidase, partial [candidate division Zixibacteria bacterium]|nr:S8 family serine peptidase [candidate division Zixibacteria bacterium]NIX57142.1 S8 family serine peptidase [candidate division Zixibacteria bacterium]